MARIWQEGFEDGVFSSSLSNFYYEYGGQYHNDLAFTDSLEGCVLASGRNSASLYSLAMLNSDDKYAVKVFNSELSELYARYYFKHTKINIGSSADISESFWFEASDGTKLFSIYNVNITGADDWAIYVKKSGTYQKVSNLTLSSNVWYRIDIYYKANSSTGAYEVKLNDLSIISESNINTGTQGVKKIKFGTAQTAIFTDQYSYFDDIAVNDTTGSINNSWCGSGTIISLKPKGTGNKSQWDSSLGYAKAESGTNTTTIKITGHGLSTNDVVYNKTREAYRIVTVTDANTMTVTSITGQTTNDVILLYKNVATITATSGTSNSIISIPGHKMNSGDVIVNTTRSNAIRRVVLSSGNFVYNSYTSTAKGTIGSTVSSQTTGDSIKTFAFKPYTITNHWEAVSNIVDPNPKLSYIESATVNDIDTFDMEEIVADKGLPSGTSIVAISHNVYVQEAGAGSQIKPVFRISGTDYEGSAISMSGGTLSYQQIYETSPATSSAWSRSEVDALEAGVKLV